MSGGRRGVVIRGGSFIGSCVAGGIVYISPGAPARRVVRLVEADHRGDCPIIRGSGLIKVIATFSIMSGR